MEDLPGSDPVLPAFLGDDPQQLVNMLKRYAILLGELQGRALPHTQRFVALRKRLARIFPPSAITPQLGCSNNICKF